MNHEKVADLIRNLLSAIEEDPKREGLMRTPERVARSIEFLTSGYHQDPKSIIGHGVFSTENHEMVVLRDIDFYSLCEHHMLPFFGRAHVAYLPNQKTIGLSKLARVVEVFSRRLQVQERLTHQIATTLEEQLNPQGVAVVIEARHLCMQMRGVQRQNSVATTSSMLGAFLTQPETRAEFMKLILGAGKY